MHSRFPFHSVVDGRHGHFWAPTRCSDLGMNVLFSMYIHNGHQELCRQVFRLEAVAQVTMIMVSSSVTFIVTAHEEL